MKSIFKEDSIIYLNGFVYLIDKEIELEQNDVYYDDLTKLILVHSGQVYESMPAIIQSTTGTTTPEGIAWKIVATNNPKLEGVPKLPEFPIIDYKAVCIDQSKMALQANPKNYEKILSNLWEAASSKKKYNEDDMRKAFRAGTNYGGFYQKLAANEDWEAMERMNEIGIEPDFQKLLQSLTPKIKEIELEVKSYNDPEDGYMAVHLKSRLKVDDKGLLLIKSIKYE